MSQLDPRIKIKASLRCDGIGRLDCAEHADSGDRLAVRWLPLSANGDAAVRACEKLPAHPALPRILQTGRVGTSAFLALEFPEGKTLAAALEMPLPTSFILNVGLDLCQALAAVHSQGVIHGEMSPDSVLILDSGRSFLWDMPLIIAHRLTDRRGESRLLQNLVKTGAYLSPERAQGEEASASADIYALAALMCMASGTAPPSAPSTLGLIHAIASGKWRPQVSGDFAPHWQRSLQDMLHPDPKRRPTATEVVARFSEARLASMPTMREVPATPTPILKPAAPSDARADGLRASRQEPRAQPPHAIDTVQLRLADGFRVHANPDAFHKTDPLFAVQPAPPEALDPNRTLDLAAPPTALISTDPVLVLPSDQMRTQRIRESELQAKMPVTQMNHAPDGEFNRLLMSGDLRRRFSLQTLAAVVAGLAMAVCLLIALLRWPAPETSAASAPSKTAATPVAVDVKIAAPNDPQIGTSSKAANPRSEPEVSAAKSANPVTQVSPATANNRADDDEELGHLLKTKDKSPPPKPVRPAAKRTLEPAAPAAKTPKSPEFEFLEKDAPVPQEELKRPAIE
jgi:serine/threonine protein kinase